MEYYSAIKKEQVLIYAITRMNLNNIMPSEGSWTQKTTNCLIPLIRNSRKSKAMVIADQLLLGAGVGQ